MCAIGNVLEFFYLNSLLHRTGLFSIIINQCRKLPKKKKISFDELEKQLSSKIHLR